MQLDLILAAYNILKEKELTCILIERHKDRRGGRQDFCNSVFWHGAAKSAQPGHHRGGVPGHYTAACGTAHYLAGHQAAMQGWRSVQRGCYCSTLCFRPVLLEFCHHFYYHDYRENLNVSLDKELRMIYGEDYDIMYQIISMVNLLSYVKQSQALKRFKYDNILKQKFSISCVNSSFAILFFRYLRKGNDPQNYINYSVPLLLNPSAFYSARNAEWQQHTWENWSVALMNVRLLFVKWYFISPIVAILQMWRKLSTRKPLVVWYSHCSVVSQWPS